MEHNCGQKVKISVRIAIPNNEHNPKSKDNPKNEHNLKNYNDSNNADFT